MTGLWRRCIWEVLSRGGGGLTSEGPWQSTLGRSWSGSGFSVSVGTNHQKSETSLGGHGGPGSSEPLTTVTATIRTWRYVKCRLCLGGLLHAKQMVKSLSLVASQAVAVTDLSCRIIPCIHRACNQDPLDWWIYMEFVFCKFDCFFDHSWIEVIGGRHRGVGGCYEGKQASFDPEGTSRSPNLPPLNHMLGLGRVFNCRLTWSG